MVAPIVPVVAGVATAIGGAGAIGTAAIGAAAGLGAAGAAATTAGITISTATAIQLGIALGSIAYSIAARPNGKDRRDEGGGFLYTNNPDDPQTPIPLYHGYPVVVPPRFARFNLPLGLNEPTPSKDEIRATLLCLGYALPWGIDGGDLKVWADDTLLADDVGSDDDGPVGLTQDNTHHKPRRVFVFPQSWVDPATVIVYIDGVRFGVGGVNASRELGDEVEVTYPDAYTSVRKYVKKGGVGIGFTDQSIPVSVSRYGFFLPVDALVTDGSMKVTVHKQSARLVNPVFGRSPSRGQTSFVADPRDIVRSELSGPEQKQYYYFLDQNGSGEFITGFTVSYKGIPNFLKIEIDPNTGRSTVVFPTDRPEGEEVTASFKWRNDRDVSWHMRTGTLSDEPLPMHAARQTIVVGHELERGISETYSGENEVHDIIVGIHSGQAGFFDQAQAGPNAGDTRFTFRDVLVQFKASDAPDVATDTIDPAKGWVTLRSPKTNLAQAHLTGQVKGTAKWSLSIADWYRYTLHKETGSTWNNQDGHNSLEFGRYDVKLTALDAHGFDYFGLEAGDRVQNKVFFATATEALNINLKLPGVATLMITEKNPGETQGERLFRVQVKGRRVWVPDADATMFNLNPDGSPKGEPKWSRNPTHVAMCLPRIEYHGPGLFYGWEHVTQKGSLARWLEAAAFHDAIADDEAYAEYDGALTERLTVGDAMATILQGANAYPLQSGGAWSVLIDKRRTAVMRITDGDLLAEVTKAAWSAMEERPDELEVAYNAAELDQELTSLLVREEGPEPPHPRRTRRVDFYGVRRKTQIKRVALRELRSLRLNRFQFDLQFAALNPIALQPMDFIELTSARIGADKLYCRVMKTRLSSARRPSALVSIYDPAVDETGAAFFRSTALLAPVFAQETSAAFTDPAPQMLEVQRNADGTITIDVGDLEGASAA